MHRLVYVHVMQPHHWDAAYLEASKPHLMTLHRSLLLKYGHFWLQNQHGNSPNATLGL